MNWITWLKNKIDAIKEPFFKKIKKIENQHII